jgi:hypothetical protein
MFSQIGNPATLATCGAPKIDLSGASITLDNTKSLRIFQARHLATLRDQPGDGCDRRAAPAWGGAKMKIHPNSQLRSITAKSVICQIDVLARFISGDSGNPGFSLAELRQVADAFRSAYQPSGVAISERMMNGTRPDDPGVDFG